MNAKKLLKETEGKFQELGEDVKTAGRAVWMAGLGAFAEADQQGRSLFEDLVSKGRKVQEERKESLNELFAEPRRRAKKVGEWATGTARESMDSVTQRSTELLQRLGVPTYEDIRTLNEKVAELNQKVEALHSR